jgi:hypothetical protein
MLPGMKPHKAVLPVSQKMAPRAQAPQIFGR